MTAAAWAWAICLSGFAYWLGRKTGWKRGCAAVALLMYQLGVRGLDSTTKTITFADGTTRKEKS